MADDNDITQNINSSLKQNGKKDCSQIYAPIWKRQIVIIISLSVLSLSALFLLHRKELFLILFGAVIVVGVINAIILKCPSCGCSICWNAKGATASGPSFIPINKECPKCGAILRK